MKEIESHSEFYKNEKWKFVLWIKKCISVRWIDFSSNTKRKQLGKQFCNDKLEKSFQASAWKESIEAEFSDKSEID